MESLSARMLRSVHRDSPRLAPDLNQRMLDGPAGDRRSTMKTRPVTGFLEVAGTVFVLALLFLHSGSAWAQSGAAPPGHFDPKGKPPSSFTQEVLRAGRDHAAVRRQAGLRGAEEGLHRAGREHKIMADDGHVAWDMERFQFLNGSRRTSTAFDPVPAPHFHAEHELRAVRGDPRHLPGPRLRPRRHLVRPRQDRLDRHRSADHGRTGSRGAEAVPEARWQGPSGHGGDLLALARRPLGRRARGRRRSGRAGRQGRHHRAARLHAAHDLRERVRRQRDEPAAVLPVRPAAACEPLRLRRPGPRPGRVGRAAWG